MEWYVSISFIKRGGLDSWIYFPSVLNDRILCGRMMKKILHKSVSDNGLFKLDYEKEEEEEENNYE